MKELQSIIKLADSFQRLPGVGRKSAEKMAYSVLAMKPENIESFAAALLEVRNNVHKCPICGNYTEEDICEVCSDENRDHTKIIVVSESKDIVGFEKLRSYDGAYHVLGGVLSAVNGVGIEDLNMESLLRRIDEDGVKEIILATNPTVEGETTALYIAKILEGKGVNVSRLAYGLPMGGHLEYADSLTLSKALEGRKKI